ncbi:hypothetical protein B0H19DRAFT_1259695 [Mycena capillaripes]|nr:hypothetical protein B0H19DRAFT_1259695 [Mycena capillaripes]
MAKRPMLHISMVSPVTARLFITSISRFSPKPILELIKKLKKLSGQLPENVPGRYDTVGGTFNRCFDDVLICVLSRILREKLNIQLVPENSQICSLAHVVNLVVQNILATVHEAEDPD